MARRLRGHEKQRGLMLDELCALTANPALRRAVRARGSGAEGAAQRPRTWRAAARPARSTPSTLLRQRLAAVMEATIAALERHHEISLTPEHRELLYSASPAPSTACSPPSAAACASKAAP